MRPNILVVEIDGAPGKSTVLVVESKERIAGEIVALLSIRRIRECAVDSAQRWPEVLERIHPDLLLIDAQLPGASTVDICRHLRGVSRWQEVPIIVVAESDSAALRVAAYQAGADDFLGGEVSPEELRARIDVRLQRIHAFRERSDRDVLTGLLTRRAFLEQLDARLSAARRRQRTLVFCILDVDHFKRVNDRHGHLTGDQVLRTLGGLLRDRFRSEDIRGRWGGEEFTVVLVDEEAESAAVALDRVGKEFRRLRFESAESGLIFQVTFSAGLAQFPDDGGDLEALLQAADARLFRAKRGGRDAIVGPDQRPRW